MYSIISYVIYRSCLIYLNKISPKKADEPTAGLDPNQIQEVRNTMNRLGKDRTILLSTHIMQEVENLCEEIVIISKGTVKFSGSIDELRIEAGSQDLEEAFLKITGS